MATVVLPPALLVVGGLLAFPSSGHDDTHITYWVANALGREGRILNLNGDPVEQSSSLLLVLLLAAARRLSGLTMATVGGLLSLAFGVLMVEWTGRLARRVAPGWEVAARLLVALHPSVMFWSCSGMESTCAGFVLLLLIDLCDRLAAGARVTAAGGIGVALALAAALLVRPEAPAVLAGGLLGAAVLLWLGGQRVAAARLLWTLALCLGLSAALFLYRWQAFHSVFPLPVTAKTGHWGRHNLLLGLHYFVEKTSAATALLWALAALEAWRALRRRDPGTPLIALLLAFTTVQLAFTLLAGGDWMLGERFFLVTVPLASLLACRRLATGGQGRRGAAVGAAVMAVEVAGVISLTVRYGAPLWAFRDLPALPGHSFFEGHHFDHRTFIRAVPAALQAIDDVRHRKGARPVVLSTCAGAGLYYLADAELRRFEFVDLYGLTTLHMSRCALTRSLHRDYLGVRASYPYYADERQRLHSECGIPIADVVYDVYGPRYAGREEILASMGFRVVARVPSEAEPGAGVMVAVLERYLDGPR